MAAMDNTITSAEMVKGLNIDVISRFNGENSRLMELLGIFDVETVAAGTQLNQLKITGSLNTATVAEGEETPLSQYTAEAVSVGALTIKPYRKLTTAQAILQSGYVKAINKTDARMLNQVRKSCMEKFFTYLENGTTTTTGKNLQTALANADAALNDKLEQYGEAAEAIVHFVNRFDIADYLAEKDVTLQTAYGMSYLESFLGIEKIFVTSLVPAGKVYATNAENIHVYGVDFAALAAAGLAYEVADGGLIGVAHEQNFARNSCETYITTGAVYFAEVTDFIVKATINSGTAAASAQSADFAVADVDPADTNVGETAPTMANTVEEISAYADANGIDLAGCSNKTQMLEAIAAAGAN